MTTSADYTIVPAATDPQGLEQLVTLFSEAFGNDEINAALLDWQYNCNPAGRCVAFNAWSGDVLAAHYATIPVVAKIEGRTARGLLSINTATHPDHQKRGLFVRLAEATYEAGRQAGYEFVYGVANHNSVHGFVRKLGFQSVGLLETRIVISASRRHHDATASGFERVWDAASTQWRLSNPKLPADHYGVREMAGQLAIIGRSARFPAIVGLLPANTIPSLIREQRRRFGPKLWLGLDPDMRWGRSLQVKVPERFKAIPLTFIFKDLTGSLCLDPAAVRCWAMDFDAY